MLAFVHAHLMPLGGAVLAALTVSAAAAVDAGAGIATDVESRTEVESQPLESPAVVPAGLSLATDVTAEVTAVAETRADVDLALPAEAEARAAGAVDGDIAAFTSATLPQVSTGLHGHAGAEVETSGRVDRADGELVVVVPSPEPPVELTVETAANADEGLSLSLTGMQVDVESATGVTSGLELR